MFNRKENVYCPVCREDGGYIGERYSKDYFDAYCQECRATYYFKPNTQRPYKVLTDKQKKNRCYCLSCAPKYM